MNTSSPSKPLQHQRPHPGEWAFFHYLFALIMTCLFSVEAYADPAPENWLPREARVPGGIALVDITHHYKPGTEVQLNAMPVKVIPMNGRFMAVVGIPLSAAAPQINLRVAPKNGKAVNLPITLQPGNYPEEHLTITDTNKVSPDAKSLQRIRRETGLIRKYLRHWQTDQIAHGPMILPVEGRHSSTFGRRRVINGQPRKPHSGLDIAAPTGTSVFAPADGTVIGGGDFFFNGNSLFIDHGEGLISMFCHLDEQLVEIGTQVNQGALVARVGATGRVTGPHLHWSLSLNDARVDPLLYTTTHPVRMQ
jgi:murein DD-endopeptidase MepM/ murein hydrolase activator NlpD